MIARRLGLRLRPPNEPSPGAARDRRLQALYRRRVRESVRVAAAVLVVAGLLPVGISAWRGGALLAGVLLVDAPLTAIALAVAWLASGRGRRWIEILGVVVGLVPVAQLASVPLFAPEQTQLVVGAIGMIPLGFVLFVPLEPRIQLVWFGLASALLAGFAAAPVAAASVAAGGLDRQLPPLVAIWLASGSLSLIASVKLRRSRMAVLRQVLSSRTLYHQLRQQKLDGRRQDDFLAMQQQTLLAQRAELEQLRDEMAVLARLDQLTGFGNRLRLNEDLTQLVARLARGGGSAGLLLLDLDHFRRLNDAGGRLSGDAAIGRVAEVLRQTSRTGDGLYRVGGKEFLVVLHDCDEAALASAGERYVSAIETAAIHHPANPPWNVVTASAGGVELSERAGLSIDLALRAADAALTVARARGRNCLEVHCAYDRPRIVSSAEQVAAS